MDYRMVDLSLRVLAVDPGSKNIGLAISDPTGTIANPLMIIKHESRQKDANKIAELAKIHEIGIVIIGFSTDDDGLPNFEGRKSQRLARVLSSQVSIPVELWEEGFSTQVARNTRIEMGTTRKKRKGHLDDLAATIILQSYLDQKNRL